MADIAATVAALEKRVRHLEDQLEIYHLLSAYGPAADACSAKVMAELWTEDATYDAQLVAFDGRDEILAMLKSDMHQSIIQGGGAHVIGMPNVRVDGDTAAATCYARLYRQRDDGFHVWRVTACRWELVRTAEGWRINNRINRVLDGSEEARALLRRGVE